MKAPHALYYFGCVERAGHYLFRPTSDGRPWRADDEDIPADWPFGERGWKLDSTYAPLGPERQSRANVIHVEGWTVLAMWDRSVDQRGKCNANFVAKGELDFAAMVALAKAHFPTIWQRINKAAPVVLAKETP
jgi:hypothetical protein